ncbi:MAG: nuclear transport factor 2 family protein [Pseudomonadota bacterium]
MADAAAKSDVQRANDRFYDAVRTGHFARLDALWSRERPVSVKHPGWPLQRGRDDVMASWAEIFVAGNAPDVWPLEEIIIMSDRTALVYCTEVLGNASISATNVFVWEDGDWRLTQHITMTANE